MRDWMHMNILLFLWLTMRVTRDDPQAGTTHQARYIYVKHSLRICPGRGIIIGEQALFHIYIFQKEYVHEKVDTYKNTTNSRERSLIKDKQ